MVEKETTQSFPKGNWREYLLEKSDSLDSVFSIQGTVAKVDEDRQLVFGWASIVSEKDKPVIDQQGDLIEEADMEEAAYEFVLSCRRGGEMHYKDATIGRLVESVAFTKEKQDALGIDLGFVGWWIGFKIFDKAAWAKVKSGKYRAFSIHGKGVREKIEEGG